MVRVPGIYDFELPEKNPEWDERRENQLKGLAAELEEAQKRASTRTQKALRFVGIDTQAAAEERKADRVLRRARGETLGYGGGR